MVGNVEKLTEEQPETSRKGLAWQRALAIAIATVMIASVGIGVIGAVLAAPAPSHSAPALTTGGAGGISVSPPGPVLKDVQSLVSPAVLVGAHTGGKGATLEYSSNWAGFAAEPAAAGEIQEVTAEWFVPTITCPSTGFSGTSVQVSWVGIDGYSNGNVEQVGTLSYCSSPGATPQYYSWYEFYPYNDITTVTTVGSADFVAAYVLYNPAECYGSACGVYTLVFHDLDSGISWAVTGNPSTCNSAGCETGPDADAECISEAPTGFGHSGVVPLAKYSTTTFYACAAEINGSFKGIGSFGGTTAVYRIEQVTSSDKIIQATSSASSYYFGKSEFTVTWKRYG